MALISPQPYYLIYFNYLMPLGFAPAMTYTVFQTDRVIAHCELRSVVIFPNLIHNSDYISIPRFMKTLRPLRGIFFQSA